MKKSFLQLSSILLMVIFCSAANLFGQKNKNTNVAAYYNYEVQCMGAGMDGTQLVKVWGYGKKPNDAIEQAKKNAVQAVIFKGIATGERGCMQKPLVTAPGAEQQFQDYFNAFFQAGGKYLNYVNLSSDGSIDPKDRLKVGKQYKVGVIVSVSHAQLRKELEAAGIIKKLGEGF
ncbi:MAG: hypothetical protein Q8T08_16220 [Ignavibacteria bacterium]|nr:hypothetical protein [Ignavibacteria bacterium]